MSRDKQISEIEIMAGEIDRILCEAETKAPYPPLHPSIVRAKALYNAGYRKVDSVTFMGGIVEQMRADVAEEIFEEIEKAFTVKYPMCTNPVLVIDSLSFAELKKKYIVTDTNDGCKDTESEKDNG